MAKDRKIDMVMLGLLSHEDLTGYDIKKRIDGVISFFWKGSFGSIYPALNDMEKNGLIESRTESRGAREKILYHITDKGNESLKDWLREEQTSNDLKYETLLKLYFGGVEEREVTVHNIEIFEEETRRSLSVLRIYRDNLEKVLDDGDHLNYYLTLSFGIDTYEAYLKWCTRAKKILMERGVHLEK